MKSNGPAVRFLTSGLKRPVQFSNRSIAAMAIVTAIFGIAVIIGVRAAGPFASIEPEDGTLSGAVSIGTDTNASGGKYVQFGGSSSSAPLVPSNGVLFGAWHKPTPTDTWSQTEYTNFETTVGRKMSIDHRYDSWGTTYWPGSPDTWDVTNGRIPMHSIGGNSVFPGLDAVNNGSQDAWIAGTADRIKAFGSKMFLRPLWEMNGNWYSWDGTHNNTTGQTDGPAKYVQAWKHVHDIFVAHGASNAVWVWSPNCSDNPTSAWNHYTNYYPGDSYVDWVACDGYNWGTTKSYTTWESWASVFGGSPSIYSDYLRKPFMVAETGACEQGGDKGAWITAAANSMKTSFTNVKAFVYFDEFFEQSINCDWRVTSSQGALDAYKAMGADAYFNGL
jgi:hypothetical protein